MIQLIVEDDTAVDTHILLLCTEEAGKLTTHGCIPFHIVVFFVPRLGVAIPRKNSCPRGSGIPGKSKFFPGDPRGTTFYLIVQ